MYIYIYILYCPRALKKTLQQPNSQKGRGFLLYLMIFWRATGPTRLGPRSSRRICRTLSKRFLEHLRSFSRHTGSRLEHSRMPLHNFFSTGTFTFISLAFRFSTGIFTIFSSAYRFSTGTFTIIESAYRLYRIIPFIYIYTYIYIYIYIFIDVYIYIYAAVHGP